MIENLSGYYIKGLVNVNCSFGNMSILLENIKSHFAFNVRNAPLAIDQLEIGRQLLAHAADYIKLLGVGTKLLVVSDRNTYQAAASEIESCLMKAGYHVQSAIFDKVSLKPTLEAVKQLQEGIKHADLCIAVGSGTINDICKYASFLENKPYVVFATAPSMNGYASANASLIINGYRTSKQAHLPKAIYMDLDVMAHAPKRLIRSGVGDMLCRTTVQFDWLLSHMLLDTHYDALPFDSIKEEEGALLESAADVVNGDEEALAVLCQALIKSGLGMWYCGGSYPASQSEHMVAHVMEMAFPKASQKSYHGEQIAVTTLAVASLQERLLESDNLPFIKERFNSEQLLEHLSAEIVESLHKDWESKSKLVSAYNKNDKLPELWCGQKESLRALQEPQENLLQAFQAAGLGMTPESLGWSSEKFDWAVQVTYMTRSRFTCLDFGV